MKKYGLTLLVMLSFAHLSFGQDYGKSQLIGRWAEFVFFVPDSCSLDSIPELEDIHMALEEWLSDSLIIAFATEFNDSSYWDIQFMADSTYLENDSSYCAKSYHQSHGNWDYKDGELALKGILSPCIVPNWGPVSDFFQPIQWYSPTVYYECAEEGPGNHLIIMYKKIPEILYIKS
jgi:hypothetical protein